MSEITIGRIEGALCIKEKDKNPKRVDININPIKISVPDELLYPLISVEKIEGVIRRLVIKYIKEISDKKNPTNKAYKKEDDIYEFEKEELNEAINRRKNE